MPELPTTAKGSATSRRILDAAAEEFAQRGIAGARIERVVQAAHTNKAQLYGYFGSKDGLFDAVIADSADRLMAAIPFDGDLVDWAVRMYDENVRNPDMVRLATWLRLERRPAGWLTDDPDHHAKVAAITAAQEAGRVRSGAPLDLMVMVIAMACAWSAASGVYAATADEPAADHDRRRTLLRECVERAVAP
jgi:AcrR family transcriptional regulator